MQALTRRGEAETELARQEIRIQGWTVARDATLHRYRCARVRYVANNCLYIHRYDDMVGGEDWACSIYKRRAMEAGERMNIERGNIRSANESIRAAEVASRIQWEEIRESRDEW
jgi:hypothetical protein